MSSKSKSIEKISSRLTHALVGTLLPYTLIFNEHLDVVHQFGIQNDYLKSTDSPLADVTLDDIIDELSTPLRSTINEAFRLKLRHSLYDLTLKGNLLNNRSVTLELIPLLGSDVEDDLVAVMFFEYNAPARIDAVAGNPNEKNTITQLEDRILILERELYSTQIDLRVKRQELQILDDERRSTKEDLLSSNRNYESLNIELSVVNEEYRKKVFSLAEALGDIENLTVMTVFLDDKLNVRRYSSDCEQLLNLSISDIGRPFTSVSHTLNKADVNRLVEGVQFQRLTIERELQDEDGRWYLLCIKPYTNEVAKQKGILLELQDISRMKSLQSELLEALIR